MYGQETTKAEALLANFRSHSIESGVEASAVTDVALSLFLTDWYKANNISKIFTNPDHPEIDVRLFWYYFNSIGCRNGRAG